MEAMKVEYNTIMKNRTSELVEHSKKCKIIDTMFERYKARLVMKGFVQV